jgi:Protein of unknown function (DUF2845)
MEVGMNSLVGIVGVLSLVALSTLSYADTMRCDTGHLVSSGDTTTDVLTGCGEPTQRDRWQECPQPHTNRPPSSSQRPFYRTDCATLERWTYNFGPQRLVHSLLFKHGRLVTIQTRGHGQ